MLAKEALRLILKSRDITLGSLFMSTSNFLVEMVRGEVGVVGGEVGVVKVEVKVVRREVGVVRVEVGVVRRRLEWLEGGWSG